MLGALVLSALALAVPHTGQPFVAYKHTGAAGELSCSGVVGGNPVPVRYQRAGDTTACILLIPRRTAGKILVWNHSITRSVSTTRGDTTFVTTTHQDGLARRVLIRR